LLGLLISGTDWRHALKELAALEKPDTDEVTVAYAKFGVWWGGVANLGILILLAATFRFWSVPVRVGEPLPKPAPVTKWGWMVLLGALLIGGWVRWDRADLSLYNDEAHAFRRYTGGQWRADKKSAEIKFREVSWLKTFFFNPTANNAPGFSVLGRLSHDTWGKLSGLPKGELHARSLRFPNVLAGLSALVFLWLLLRRTVSPIAAGWAVCLGAGHFWMVRYGNEARGYGMTLAALSLMAYATARAMEAHRWRWWLLVGIAQFVALWTFSGSFYFLLVFNLALLARAWWRWQRQRIGDAAGFYRPLVGMSLGAMLTLPLMLPVVLQMFEAMKVLDSLKGTMDAAWWKEIGLGLIGGVKSLGLYPAGEPIADAAVTAQWGLGRQVLAGLVILLTLLGLWKWGRQPFVVKLFAIAGLIALLIAWTSLSRQGIYLHPWYVIYALPGLLVLWAIGAEACCRSPLGRWGPPLLAAGVVGLHFATVTLPLRGIAKEPIRAVVEEIKAQSKSAQPVHLMLYSDADIYQPNAQLVKEADFTSALDKAVASGAAEIWVSYTRRRFIAAQDPALLEKLEQSGLFTQARMFPALNDEHFTHYLVKWKGVASP
jgi:hypothetical protein